MNSPAFSSLWVLMRKYTFKTDPDSIIDNLTCIICLKLMVDASQGVCGCQYCYECIFKYLSGGGKYCPGEKSECIEDHLVLERDVLKNIRLNNKISKLRVLCPNEWCNYMSELSEMEEHLRVCLEFLIECPYDIVGCDKAGVSHDTICNHLRDEAFSHARLYTEYIQNIKNEVDSLTYNCNCSTLTLSSLGEDARTKDRLIEEQRLEIEDLKEKATMNEMNIKVLVQRLQNVENKVGLKFHRENPHMHLDRELDHSRVDGIRVDDRLTNQKRRRSDNVKDFSLKYNLNVINLESLFCSNVDFIWTIEEWTKAMSSMTRRGILSQPFYSNNYKMCLRVWINRDVIGLYCIIMKGDQDDYLEWPMMGAVTLSIIDQHTGLPYHSLTLQHDSYNNKVAFSKPKFDMNECISAPGFAYYSAIKLCQSVFVDDCMIVTCAVAHTSLKL